MRALRALEEAGPENIGAAAARLVADALANLWTDLGDDPVHRVEVAAVPPRDEDAERVLALLFPHAAEGAEIAGGDRGAGRPAPDAQPASAVPERRTQGRSASHDASLGGSTAFAPGTSGVLTP